MDVGPALSLAVSTLSLTISAGTAWLTLWRRGTLKLAQPPSVYFGPDGRHPAGSKVFLRGFLYSTSARGHIVEGMFVRVRRGDSVQSFPVWVCGEGRLELTRGAGLKVDTNGLALHHHFMLQGDGTAYHFLPGQYVVEVFAVVIGRTNPFRLRSIALQVTEAQSRELTADKPIGLYFDWSPETQSFSGHLDRARPPEDEGRSLADLANLAVLTKLLDQAPAPAPVTEPASGK
jgi:hypothetical protein